MKQPADWIDRTSSSVSASQLETGKQHVGYCVCDSPRIQLWQTGNGYMDKHSNNSNTAGRPLARNRACPTTRGQGRSRCEQLTK
eukprot:15472351-Alexandrium_andersonii.AAC.1